MHRLLALTSRLLWLLSSGLAVKSPLLSGRGPLVASELVRKKLGSADKQTLFASDVPPVRSAAAARELRLRRSQYRLNNFARPAVGAILDGETSFCENEAVSPAVRLDYSRRIQKLLAFARKELQLELVPGPRFVPAVMEFMDQPFSRVTRRPTARSCCRL
jgi:hypothetical protein